MPGNRAADGAFRRLVACWTVAMREVCGETPCSASVLTDVGRVKAAVGRHREPAPRAARPAILTLGDTASDDDAETQRSKYVLNGHEREGLPAMDPRRPSLDVSRETQLPSPLRRKGARRGRFEPVDGRTRWRPHTSRRCPQHPRRRRERSRWSDGAASAVLTRVVDGVGAGVHGSGVYVKQKGLPPTVDARSSVYAGEGSAAPTPDSDRSVDRDWPLCPAVRLRRRSGRHTSAAVQYLVFTLTLRSIDRVRAIGR